MVRLASWRADDHPEQCVIANRQHHPGCKAGSWPAARGEALVLNDMVEELSPACSRRKDAGLKALREDLAAT